MAGRIISLPIRWRTPGIETTFVDARDVQNFSRAIRNNTKALYVESLGNPNCDIVDMEALAEVAHAHGIPLIVDSTFATPFLFRPLEHGADIVVHSATKFIGGHGTVMGGVIVDGGKFDWTQNDKFPGISKPNPNYHGAVFAEVCGNLAYIVKIRATLLRDTGATIQPVQLLPAAPGAGNTLPAGGTPCAERLARSGLSGLPSPGGEGEPPLLPDHPDHDLYKRYYPNGGGSIFTFEIKGGAEKARKFCESLELFSLLANVRTSSPW